MTTTQIKKNLHHYIDRMDERFLTAMYVMAKEYLKISPKTKEEDYTMPGKPMSVETFRKRILTASKSAKQGKTISQEDIEKEAKKWQ